MIWPCKRIGKIGQDSLPMSTHQFPLLDLVNAPISLCFLSNVLTSGFEVTL